MLANILVDPPANSRREQPPPPPKSRMHSQMFIFFPVRFTFPKPPRASCLCVVKRSKSEKETTTTTVPAPTNLATAIIMTNERQTHTLKKCVLFPTKKSLFPRLSYYLGNRNRILSFRYHHHHHHTQAPSTKWALAKA